MIPGKRINLWAIEKGDLLQNYLWGNDPEIVKLTGITPIPRTAWDIEKWYESLLGNPNVQTFAIKLNDGTYIGNVEISKIDWRCRSGELGIVIGDRKSRGKGYGKEAVLMVARYAFEELGLHRLYARVLSYNKDAQKFFESLGFKKEGTERESFLAWGRFWDVYVYSMLDEEFFKLHPYKPLEDEEAEKGDGENEGN